MLRERHDPAQRVAAYRDAMREGDVADPYAEDPDPDGPSPEEPAPEGANAGPDRA